MARTRVVIAVDGREWRVRRRTGWGPPPDGDVEHDADGARGGLAVVLGGLVLSWVVLLVWRPDGVHVPWWLYAYAGLAVLALAVRWILRRPHLVTAITAGSYDLPPERWIGVVTGYRAARTEVAVTVAGLRRRGTPGHADGPLRPVD